MTEYTITIDGYKSGLTGKTIEQSMREQFGGPGVDITVSEAQSEISVERRGEYVNVFYDGRLMASLSEKHDELLVYKSGTDEPISNYTLSQLREGFDRGVKVGASDK
jgi:hypothetical protein